MAPKPVSDKQIPAPADDPAAPELDKKLAADTDTARRPVGDKRAISSPSKDEDEDGDALEIEDDEDDEDLVVFTAKEAAGALATIYAFVKPYLKNYKKILTFVGLGVVVETLFNVFMPLSLKFLIDDALGEEDFQALYIILGVLAAVALLVFPITLIGPRILTPKAVQANYDQKLNESALLGMVQENIAAQAVVKAFSLQRRTFGWFTMRNNDVRQKTASALFLSTMVERTVTISVLLLHLVVLAIGAYLATKGQITIGTFVTFESAFWEVSYNIAHLMHFIPVSIQSAAPVRHVQELLDAPTRGAGRPGAPDLPRITNDITFDRVTFQYEGAASPVLDNLSLKLNVGKS